MSGWEVPDFNLEPPDLPRQICSECRIWDECPCGCGWGWCPLRREMTEDEPSEECEGFAS